MIGSIAFKASANSSLDVAVLIFSICSLVGSIFNLSLQPPALAEGRCEIGQFQKVSNLFTDCHLRYSDRSTNRSLRDLAETGRRQPQGDRDLLPVAIRITRSGHDRIDGKENFQATFRSNPEFFFGQRMIISQIIDQQPGNKSPLISGELAIQNAVKIFRNIGHWVLKL
jgi:hypothetical protein